jgi:heme/copper-type cytochrome/quinol oxidase subunit 2
LLYYSNITINHCLIEFTSTLFSLLFLILIISPALIILLDFDLIILPSFIIYSLGLQWAWQFNIIFLPVNIGFESYCDHYIISSINKKLIIRGLATNKSIVTYIINNSAKISSCMVTRYLFDISQYILLPIYSFIRLFVYSFDVIHTLGFYSWGIKIDAIPGRINLANTLRLLWKGEYRGKCFELCGQGHLSMIINSLVILIINIISCFPIVYTLLFYLSFTVTKN